MKTIILFLSIALSAQIVKADDIRDATLKEKGKQNEASTIAWLKAFTPDGNLITMGINYFNQGFKQCLTEYNQKYKTFAAINSDVINDEIIPKLYTQDLVEGKLYTFSFWNVTTQSWGRWTRTAKKGETGLFYPGWAEPIMSVYCWNFGYPDATPAIVPVASKTEVVILPGVNKYIYKTDTIRERYDNYKEVENNFFLTTRNNTFTTTNNQSFDVETNAKYAKNVQDNCNCQQQRNNSCGCDDDHICSKHAEKAVKEKKGFFNRGIGKFVIFAVGYGAGYLTKYLIDQNNPQIIYGTRGIEQPPFDPGITTIQQPPLELLN